MASTASDDVEPIKILGRRPPIDCAAEQRHAVTFLDPFVGNVVGVDLCTASLGVCDVAPVQNEDA